jgi:quercetin dioxygenase-like cupin family protein
MGRIAIRQESEIQGIRPIDTSGPAQRDRLSQGELECVVRRFFPAEGEGLELFEVEFQPDAIVQAHAHSASEIIYVTRGELVLGARRCGPGSAIYIDADTLYGFRAGPEGATFLNFRGNPRPDYLFKEDLLQRLGGGTAGRSA